MLRILTLFVLVSAGLQAAVWPPQIGSNQLQSEQNVAITADKALWTEYGLESATLGDYGPFQVTAYRFKDATGAFAAEQWIASADKTARLAGNYVVTCTGRCPSAKEREQVKLPGQRRDELPLVWAYMPQGRIASSERYALGPAGLSQFAPQVPPAMAAFQFSTEVGIAKYREGKAEEQLVLMSFPVPQMARQQAAQLLTLNGAAVKRTGPLVAVVLNSPDPAAAQKLLSQINYTAQVNWDEKPPVKVTAQSVASMILTIFWLAGLLILFCLLAGLGFAGVRVLRKRLGYENADEAMILLHLVDR